MRISYYQDDAGNYIVKMFFGCYFQTIVVVGGYFRKVMQSKGNVSVGCCDADSEVLVRLGFILPQNLEKMVV